MDIRERSNPFDDNEADYLVLVNYEGQYSLWPVHIDVPKGWEVAHTADNRKSSLDFIAEVWTDMRPRTLREFHRKISDSPSSF